MRMLVKYTAFVDFNKDGEEMDRSYYLSFVRGEDVMDLPFESMAELQKKASAFSIAEYVKGPEFLEKIKDYADYQEFFGDVNTLVLYDDSVGVDFSEILGLEKTEETASEESEGREGNEGENF